MIMACFEEQRKNATDLLDDGFADSRCGPFCFVLFCTVTFGAAAESSRGIVAITRGIKVGS
jgi:hypothetical protein